MAGEEWFDGQHAARMQESCTLSYLRGAYPGSGPARVSLQAEAYQVPSALSSLRGFLLRTRGSGASVPPAARVHETHPHTGEGWTASPAALILL